MTLYIKYMGSLRCKMMVKEELKKLGLHYTNIDFGKGEIIEDITQEQHDLSGSLSGRYGRRRPNSDKDKASLKAGENGFLQTSLFALFRTSNSVIQMK